MRQVTNVNRHHQLSFPHTVIVYTNCHIDDRMLNLLQVLTPFIASVISDVYSCVHQLHCFRYDTPGGDTEADV